MADLTPEEWQAILDQLFPTWINGIIRPADPIPTDLPFSTVFPQFVRLDPARYDLLNAFLRQLLSNDAKLMVEKMNTLVAGAGIKIESADGETVISVDGINATAVKRNTAYAIGNIAYNPSLPAWMRLECVVAGTTGETEPAWTDTGTLVTDGTVAWIIDDIRDGSMPGDIVLRHILRSGYIKANGALISRAAYPRLFNFANNNNLIVTETIWTSSRSGMFGAGDGSTTFRVPDLRGEFIRGWDDSRGVDSGRVLGSYQSSQNLSHSHSGTYGYTYISYQSGSGSSGVPNGNASTGSSGGNESRPRNIALMAQIKY